MITKLTRWFLPSLLAIVTILLIAVPVLAAYYATVQVVESDSISYSMLPIMTDLDTDTLTSYHYITSTGLDTRVKTGSGTPLPHMLTDDKLLFVSPINADSTYNYQFTAGNTPLISFPVITGYGGYVTITNHANLELGNDFEIEFEGWVDTSVPIGTNAILFPIVETTDTSVENAGTTSHTVDLPAGIESGDLLLMLFGASGVATITWPDGWTELDQGTSSGAAYKIASGSEGSSVTVLTSASRTSAHQTLRISRYNGTPEVSASASGTSVNPNSASLTPSWGSDETLWVSFYGGNDAVGSKTISSYPTNYSNGLYAANTTGYVYTGSARRELVAVSEDPGQYVLSGAINWYAWTIGVQGAVVDTLVYKANAFAIYVEEAGTLSACILGGTPKIVSKELSSDEYIVNVWADGTWFGIDIDGEFIEKVAVSSVPVNNDFILSMPYFNYYQHTTSDTLRLTYEPDDIIVGTVLPNELSPGTYNGAITWGANPAGINVTIGTLISESQLMPNPNIPSDQPAPDIIQPTGGVMGGFGELIDNPLYPVVNVISGLMNVPVPIVWVLGAFLILLIVMAICFFSVPHQLITGIAGIGLTYLFFAMGIFPWWTLVVMGCVMIALIFYERKPSF